MPKPLGISWKSLFQSARTPLVVPSIESAAGLAGKRVFVRASLNVPIQDGEVLNDFRLRSLLPTIEHLKSVGARVVIAGHIGREPELSLRPVCKALNKHTPITFVADVVGEQAQKAVKELKNGEALLLENLRRHPGEKGNTESFAKELAALADVYVNEAFSVSHREHASIVGVPELLPHYAGLQLVQEVQELTRALSPRSPSLFILGGAKFETKKPLIEKFMSLYNTLFVGGAIANDFYSAMGYSTGVSVTSKDAKGLTDIIGSPNILIPADLCALRNGKARITTINDIKPDEYIADIGPKTVELLAERISQARYVLWNGPLGDTSQGYVKGTEDVAKAVAASKAESFVGGGDTVAAIARQQLEDQFAFVSTGGGAMLQFLANETLPGIDVLCD